MSDTKKLATAGDVVGFLYDCEHAPAYCSPPWGRNATHLVLEVILDRGGYFDFEPYGASATARDVAKYLRAHEELPRGRRVLPSGAERDKVDQDIWDRARLRIADDIEKRT